MDPPGVPLGKRYTQMLIEWGIMGDVSQLIFKLIKFLGFYNEHSIVTIKLFLIIFIDFESNHNNYQRKKKLFLLTIFPFPLREQKSSHVSGNAMEAQQPVEKEQVLLSVGEPWQQVLRGEQSEKTSWKQRKWS